MNPFEDTNNNEFDIDESNDITLWIETRGRKTNTYMTGWNKDKAEQKAFLKEFKKKNGCNGSIKEKVIDGEKSIVFHLQGNWQDALIAFLVDNGVSDNDITKKG